MADRLLDWKERCKQECACGLDTVSFLCKDQGCPNREKQPLYCLQCMTNGVHWHQPLIYISDEIVEY